MLLVPVVEIDKLFYITTNHTLERKLKWVLYFLLLILYSKVTTIQYILLDQSIISINNKINITGSDMILLTYLTNLPSKPKIIK